MVQFILKTKKLNQIKTELDRYLIQLRRRKILVITSEKSQVTFSLPPKTLPFLQNDSAPTFLCKSLPTVWLFSGGLLIWVSSIFILKPNPRHQPFLSSQPKASSPFTFNPSPCSVCVIHPHFHSLQEPLNLLPLHIPQPLDATVLLLHFFSATNDQNTAPLHHLFGSFHLEKPVGFISSSPLQIATAHFLSPLNLTSKTHLEADHCVWFLKQAYCGSVKVGSKFYLNQPGPRMHSSKQ